MKGEDKDKAGENCARSDIRPHNQNQSLARSARSHVGVCKSVAVFGGLVDDNDDEEASALFWDTKPKK